ncbi:hypothetical protein R6242_03845 [Iodobacter sp. CM08]|uniref:hypothetical protein n=1 Tax=Iodobacter sp. CM08 TaxID=3085902 RepID=UPI002982728C|nr:hypothetical protein [Iodobacter sp. CM08]MDW5415701.1 hypothetical protein [Iodobacter sp. CM08]
MFPSVDVNEFCSDVIYQFGDCKPLYLALTEYYKALYDSGSYEERIAEQERGHEFRQDMYCSSFWWVINEAWESYGKLNPAIPMRWLAISKRALQWDYMPSNFHPWALAILESFDLPRYQAAYHLPLDEFTAIEQDLPVVLEGLRNYPKEKLAEPMDEDNWGYVDQ